jgi:hypothetical protein
MAWQIVQESQGIKRLLKNGDITRIDVWSTGRTGRTVHGTNAAGSWKIRGYRRGGKFFHSYAEAKQYIAE